MKTLIWPALRIVAAVAIPVIVFGGGIWLFQSFVPAAHDNRSLMRLRDAMSLADRGRGDDGEAAFADAISLARTAHDSHDEQAARLMRAEARIAAGDDVSAVVSGSG